MKAFKRYMFTIITFLVSHLISSEPSMGMYAHKETPEEYRQRRGLKKETPEEYRARHGMKPQKEKEIPKIHEARTKPEPIIFKYKDENPEEDGDYFEFVKRVHRRMEEEHRARHVITSPSYTQTPRRAEKRRKSSPADKKMKEERKKREAERYLKEMKTKPLSQREAERKWKQTMSMKAAAKQFSKSARNTQGIRNTQFISSGSSFNSNSSRGSSSRLNRTCIPWDFGNCSTRSTPVYQSYSSTPMYLCPNQEYIERTTPSHSDAYWSYHN